MKSKKGKGGGGFQDQFKPPGADEEPARIVLYRPEKPYKIKLEHEGHKDTVLERDYGVLMEHFNASEMRGCRCTAGLQREDLEDGDWIITSGSDPCVPCYEIEAGTDNISHRKIHLFNLILLGDFHEIKVQKDSKSARAKNGKIEVIEYRTCRGKRCKWCKKGIEKSSGRRMYWALGPMHVEQLVNIEVAVLGRKCKCGGKIKPRAFICPECEDAVRDLDDDPIEEKGELKELREGEHQCPHCDYSGLLIEFPRCDKCQNPRPLSLWDVEMEIYMSGEKTQSTIQVSDFEPLTVKLKAKIKDKMKAYDWDQLWSYRLLKPEDQAQLLKLDNPYSGKGGDEKGSTTWDDDDDKDKD
jgi:hypothetical protein